MHRSMWLLILAVAAPSALGCGFAAVGGSLPAGHVGVSCPNQAPGVPYVDAAGEATAWPDLPYDNFYVAEAIANLSTKAATSLCYWSQQVLPSPPSAVAPNGSCVWAANASSASDVAEVYAMGAQAMAEMDTMLAGAWSFLGASCGGGASNARAACAANPASALCAPAQLGQLSNWAVASNVLRIDAASLPAVIANVSLWRSSSAWHEPIMGSAQVQRGWGTGGGISFKVLPCEAVPVPLRSAAYACDAVDARTGRVVWDEAFEFWTSYKAPAWLQSDLADLRRDLAARMAAAEAPAESASSSSPASPPATPPAQPPPNATAIVLAHVQAHMRDTFREPSGILAFPYLVPSGPYATAWDWDSMFMGVGGLAFGALPYFVGTMRNYLSLVDVASGELPGGISPTGSTGVLYHAKPVIIQASWLAARAAAGGSAAGAPVFLAYQPAMEALLAYWGGGLNGTRRVDARTGLPLWHDQLETGADNLVYSQCPSAFSPECWDEAADAFTLSSPDLVVFLAREHAAYANFLRAWAAAGLLAPRAAAARAAAADAERARLGGLLSTYMWHWAEGGGESAGYFCAYNVSSRTQITARTFQMALPVWAGLGGNASQVAAALDAVLQPDMLGAYGIRSTSSADPRYSEANIINPYSEWRGPLWVNANAMLAYTLAAAARAPAAAAVADAVVGVLAADLLAGNGTGWHEAYNADTGAPLAAPGFLSWNVLGATLQADVAAARDPFALLYP